MKTEEVRFPVGGQRQPVYEFFRSHGWIMGKFGDKTWHRADGLEANVYGSGSKVCIYRNGKLIGDGPIDEVIEAAGNWKSTAPEAQGDTI